MEINGQFLLEHKPSIPNEKKNIPFESNDPVLMVGNMVSDIYLIFKSNNYLYVLIFVPNMLILWNLSPGLRRIS